MGRLVNNSEYHRVLLPHHSRDPFSNKGYLYGPNYVPGPCINTVVELTPQQALDYSLDRPINVRCIRCDKKYIGLRKSFDFRINQPVLDLSARPEPDPKKLITNFYRRITNRQ